jgi:hypothetical protein
MEGSLSLASNGIWTWCIELVMDDDRVEGTLVDAALEGTLDGVTLRETLLLKVDALLRSRTLRVSDGNLFSILFVRLVVVVDSPDRRRLAMCESNEPLYSTGQSQLPDRARPVDGRGCAQKAISPIDKC